MNIGTCPIQGAYPHAHLRRILPTPSDDIQRQFRRLFYATGLSVDASIGARDPRLRHCILLPTAGLLVTATRTHAPLLEANCADLARVANLDVLLLRFRPPSGGGLASKDLSACLIQHDDRGQIVAREGYTASVLPQNGILLRHALPEVPNWHVSHQGMITVAVANLDQASASTPATAAQHSK
jgi:hypothetical protein